MKGQRYSKTCGRLLVEHRPEYGDHSAVNVACRDGWNDCSQWIDHQLSVEEARDLRYLLDRVIAAAETRS